MQIYKQKFQIAVSSQNARRSTISIIYKRYDEVEAATLCLSLTHISIPTPMGQCNKRWMFPVYIVTHIKERYLLLLLWFYSKERDDSLL